LQEARFCLLRFVISFDTNVKSQIMDAIRMPLWYNNMN